MALPVALISIAWMAHAQQHPMIKTKILEKVSLSLLQFHLLGMMLISKAKIILILIPPQLVCSREVLPPVAMSHWILVIAVLIPAGAKIYWCTAMQMKKI